MFAALFEAARGRTPPIDRIELFAAASNPGAIRLYESLGFVQEGRFTGRIRHPDGRADDDVPMAITLAGR
ncbi:MAG: GNAT family N-acetyltransferase [Caulobacteraceae bacterium]